MASSAQWYDDMIICSLIGRVAAESPSSVLLDVMFTNTLAGGHADRGLKIFIRELFGSIDLNGVPRGPRSLSAISNIGFVDNIGGAHWTWTKVDLYSDPSTVTLIYADGINSAVPAAYEARYTKVLEAAVNAPPDKNRSLWFPCGVAAPTGEPAARRPPSKVKCVMRPDNPTQADGSSCGPIAIDVMIGDCFGGRSHRPRPEVMRVLQLGLVMGLLTAEEVNARSLALAP
jgi:hypothetical protein